MWTILNGYGIVLVSVAVGNSSNTTIYTDLVILVALDHSLDIFAHRFYVLVLLFLF